MNLTETKSRTSILNFITSAATANSEADVIAALDKVMHPLDSREEMGAVYQDALGYNPIVAYDAMDIDRIIDDVVQNSGDVITRLVMANRERLAARTMEIFEASREEHMQFCMLKAADELFGTSDAEAIAISIGCDLADVVDLSSASSDGDDEEEENFVEPDMGVTHPDPDDDFLFGDDDDDEE